MFKRIVIRVVRVGLTLVGLIVTATLVAGYLALSAPAFYVERRTAADSPAELAAAKAEFEQSRAAAVAWLAASASRQQAQRAAAPAPAALPGADPGAFDGAYDPTRDVHTFRATEQQLNALLASQQRGRGEGLHNARVRLGDDAIELGAELGVALGGRAKNSSRSLVLSVVLQPTLTADGTLRLDIKSARAGRLPIPLRTILRWLPRPVVLPARDATLDLNPQSPHLAVKLPHSGPKSPTIKSIRCTTGEIIVELVPPVLDAPGSEPARSLTVTQAVYVGASR
jgi:uncharacterized protein YpmS